MYHLCVGRSKTPVEIYIFTFTYVPGFGKMCIVYTSDFAHLEIHKNHRERYADLKLSCRDDKGMVNLESLKVLNLCVIQNRFYESPNLKHCMCELYTFLNPVTYTRVYILA